MGRAIDLYAASPLVHEYQDPDTELLGPLARIEGEDSPHQVKQTRHAVLLMDPVLVIHLLGGMQAMLRWLNVLEYVKNVD